MITHIPTDHIVGRSLLLKPYHIKQYYIMFGASDRLDRLIHLRCKFCTHSSLTKSATKTDNCNWSHNTNHARFLDAIDFIAHDCETLVWAPHSFSRSELSNFGSKNNILKINCSKHARCTKHLTSEFDTSC